MSNNLFLVYVNPIGKDSNGLYQYEFFFSETPKNVWGEDWDEVCPSACVDTLPFSETFSLIKILKTSIPFFCIQENSCFPISYAKMNLVCLCAEDISDYEEYPDPFRLVFNYGDSFEKIDELLASRHQFFIDILEK